MKTSLYPKVIPCLFILLSMLYQAYTYAIFDLISTDYASFNIEAAAWIAPALKNTSLLTYNCSGLPLLSGYNITSSPKSFWNRTYHNLPPHNVIQLSVWIYGLDAWESGTDAFNVYVDNNTFAGWNLDVVTSNVTRSSEMVSLCGDPTKNDYPPINLIWSIPHTSVNVTLSIQDRLDEDSLNESLGFRNITMIFATQTSPNNTACGSSAIEFLDSRFCSCASNQYMSPQNSGNCHWCDPSCATCNSSTSTSCTSCTNTTYFTNNNSCYATCALPLVNSSDGTNLFCSSPCGSNYTFWDGNCTATCSAPLVPKVNNTFNMCTFPCTTTQFAYWNGTCSTVCNSPLISSIQGNRKFCTNPCNTSQVLYFNGSCLSNCTFPFVTRYEANYTYCDYPCTGSNYLYWNGTCLSTCPYPLFTRVTNSKLFCDFGCAPTEFVYWDYTCSSSCPSPLVQRTDGAAIRRNFCIFPCTTTSNYLNSNGTCATTCPAPLVSSTINNRNLCKYPCSSSQYLYWNASCLSSCPCPLVTRVNADGAKFCNYPCTSSQYLYWNGSCLPSCTSPHVIKNDNYVNFCNYQCDPDQFLWYNGTCRSTCPFPFKERKEGASEIRKYCDFPCPARQSLLSNGSCVASCPYPYVSTFVGLKSFCVLSSQTEYPYDLESQLADLFLVAPLEQGTVSIVTPFKLMQYIRYLSINMPPRLRRLSRSQGRNLMSVKFGIQIPEALKTKFGSTQLPFEYQGLNLSSNFLVNYWDLLLTIAISAVVGLFLHIIHKTAKRMQRVGLANILEKLLAILKWNFALMVFAYNIDDIIVFAAIQLKTLKAAAKTPVSLAVGILFTIIFVVLAAVFIAGLIIIAKKRRRSTSFGKANAKKEGREDFDEKLKDVQVIFRGYKQDQVSTQTFYLIYVLRIVIPMFIAVILESLPITVAVLHMAITYAMIVFIITNKPFKKGINQLQILLIESLVLFMNAIIVILAGLTLAKNTNENTIAILGDLVILANDLVNALFIGFFIVRFGQEGIRILRRKSESKTSLILLLGLWVQQSNMGFEELLDETSEETDPFVKEPVKNSYKNVKQTIMDIPSLADGDKSPTGLRANMDADSSIRSIATPSRPLLNPIATKIIDDTPSPTRHSTSPIKDLTMADADSPNALRRQARSLKGRGGRVLGEMQAESPILKDDSPYQFGGEISPAQTRLNRLRTGVKN